MIDNAIRKEVYDGNGSTVEWAIPFDYSDTEQVKLYIITDDVETEITTNFSINNNVITYPVNGAPVPEGTKVLVIRKTPLKQLESSVETPFTSADVERALDKLTCEVQEVKEDVDRALKSPEWSKESAGALLKQVEQKVETLENELSTETSQRISADSVLLNETNTLKNDLGDLGGQVSNIESKIPENTSATNTLVNQTQLLDTELNLKEDIANGIEEHNISAIAHQDIRTAIETLQLVKWVNALPETGESKYIYAVPREETDTEGKQIAALYLWDGSAWRGAGAFSLNIDPDTLATKTELSGYLPKTGGYIGGTLSIAREKGLIDTLMPESGSGSGYTRLRVYSYDRGWVGHVLHNSVGEASILLEDTGHLNIRVGNNSEVMIGGKRILTIGDKGVANGIASLDVNGKVPLSQLPDNIGGGAPTLKWYKNNTGLTVTIDDTSSASLVKVYKNGVLLEPTEDYTISGTTLTLTTALIATDKITTEVF